MKNLGDKIGNERKSWEAIYQWLTMNGMGTMNVKDEDKVQRPSNSSVCMCEES
jgi:hypothetical protein